MTTRAAYLVALGCVAAPVSAQGGPGSLAAETSFVQVSECKIGEMVVADLDGDGRDDLVLATEGDDLRARKLELWLRRAGTPAFAETPDQSFDVVRDVVAFAVADVHPHPGREIVLFSPALAVAMWRDAASEEPKLARIAGIELLWQPPNPPHTYWLDRAVVDVNADGLDDLLVPEPDSYRVLVQSRGQDGVASFAPHVLAVPPARADLRDASTARLRAQGDSIRLRLRDQDRTRLDFVVEVDESVPVPTCADWDGDGDRDVIALVERMLCVWLWDGAFTRDPSVTCALPARASSVLDPSQSAQVHDLDGDGRLDVVAVNGRIEDDDARSWVDVLLQTAAGGLPTEPTDRLMLKGFAAPPRFEDVDGDGRADLVAGTLRTDLIGQLGTGGSGRVDAQVNVFLNRFEQSGGRFMRPVALAELVQLPSDVLRGRVRRRAVASFLADLDGDGLRDFVQRTEATRVQVRRTKRNGEGLALGDVLWSGNVNERATVLPVVSDGGITLWIQEARQVMHVVLTRSAR